ncbi:MAG: PepSY-like domain-containing protein [Bacteroidales bacterium]|nr:PepSY-like domain-containing protein [Candidatus Colicola coprequi]
MKKLVSIALCMLTLTACADEKKVITLEALPQAALNILTQHIQKENVLLVTQEGNGRWAEYEVRMNDQSDWEFDGQGSLEKVEIRSGVPADLIPAAILSQVRASYPNAIVIEYNIDRHDQEVKLNNGIELTFSLAGKLLKTEVD